MTTQQEECEALLDALAPLAQEMLTKHREFFPFGGTMDASGQVSMAAGSPSNEQPTPQEIIALLEEGFREGAREGKYRATALLVDTRVLLPGETEKRDAVSVRLDHRDDVSVVVLIPYRFTEAGEPLFEEPFAAPGEDSIFPR